jgi:hypothetical protein
MRQDKTRRREDKETRRREQQPETCKEDDKGRVEWKEGRRCKRRRKKTRNRTCIGGEDGNGCENVVVD